MNAWSSDNALHDAPAGFSLIERGGPFFENLGPSYIQELADGSAVVLGIRLAERHANMQGLAHGGMLVTMADGALHANLRLRYPPGQRLMTVSLNTTFLAPARIGDWLEAHVEVSRSGRNLCFADCQLIAGGRAVLRASSVFAAAQAPREVPD